MTVQPEVLYRNILKIAQEGRGDGTVYGSATGATVSQANKTFTLTSLSIISDLTDADDLFNGYELYFPASERSYLIVDWTAATDVATVYEVPNIADTGACEIRRRLYVDDFDTDYPGRFACAGDLNKLWKGSAANTGAVLVAAMPNGIDDGGAESGTLDAWTVGATGGTTGDISVNSTSPLLGTYDFLFDRGDRTNIYQWQAGKFKLMPGRTYAIQFKSKMSTGTESNLYVSLRYSDGPSTWIPVTFTKVNAADTLNSGGGGTNNIWRPEITPTAAWDVVTFTVPEEINAGDWVLYIHVASSANDIYVDEIWPFEVIQPDTLIVGSHNWVGGLPSGEAQAVRGCRCPSDRTSFAAGDKEDLLAYSAVTVNGRGVIRETFTAPTGYFPIYEIRLGAQAGRTYEAGEIWLGERWTWERFISGQWIPNDGRIEANTVTTIGGVTRTSERYRKERRGGNIVRLTSAEANKWDAFIDEVGKTKPFWYYFPGISVLGKNAETLFMRNLGEPRPSTPNLRFEVSYQFEEM